MGAKLEGQKGQTSTDMDPITRNRPDAFELGLCYPVWAEQVAEERVHSM